MSRIDDALKRITGAGTDPRPTSILERFAERGPKLEEARASHSVVAGPYPVEGKTSASQKAPFSPVVPSHSEAGLHAATTVDWKSDSPIDPQIDHQIDAEKLVDLHRLADYAGFLARSLFRHKMLVAGTFAVALAMTVATALLLPRTYHAETKLLAQRNAVMTALSNPGRAVPWDADAPTRAAAETVLRRDNLISLIRRTNLIEEWDRTRVPILKAKDWLRAAVLRRPPLAQDEKLDQLATLLEARMWVLAGPIGDGTVTIEIEWPDAQMAYRLVQEAQQSFIDARQVAETTAIAESIGILEHYSATLHDDIKRTMTELQLTQPHRRLAVSGPRSEAGSSPDGLNVNSITASLPPVPAGALQSPALGAELNDPELRQMKATVAAKRQELTSLEEARQRQLTELQGRLAQLTTVYTSTHPSVMNVQQSIAALTGGSPQMAALKAQTDRLEAEYLKRQTAAEELIQEEELRAEAADRAAVSSREPAPRPRIVQTPRPAPAEQVDATGGETDFNSIRFRLELNQLESVLERTDGARIELAVSQAAFKYRYTVIRPAQVPKAPVRPNVSMIIVAGMVASLMLACAAALGRDLLGNRILERWQVERQLGLPVLGTV